MLHLKAIDLSIDHKPTVGSERERILRAGGRVLVKRIPVMGSDGRLMRGWGVSRVQGLLHVSRAIGILLILFLSGCLLVCISYISSIVIGVLLTYISGYFELKKNQNIPASQQMVTCDPEFTIVSISKFF